MTKKRSTSAMEAALSLLSYRMRSESEMYSKLKQKEFEQDEISETIQKLSEKGLINDREFAAELIRSKTSSKPIGRLLLKQALYKAGLDDIVIKDSLLCYTDEDEQTACDKLYIKLAEQKGMDNSAHVKIQRAMLRRGFDYIKIQSSVRRLSDFDTEIE